MNLNVNHRKIGEILVNSGYIDSETLEKAIDEQKDRKKGIGQILVDMGVVSESDIAMSLAKQFNLPFLLPDETAIPKDIVSLISFDYAMKNEIVAVKKEKNGLMVAISNPLNQQLIDDLRFRIGMPVYLAVSPSKNILTALQKNHPTITALKVLGDETQPADRFDAMNEFDMEIIRTEEVKEEKSQDLMNLAGKPPIVQYTNSIFVKAIELGASDIHIEIEKESQVVRFRIDGIMHQIMESRKDIHTSVVSRIKVISNLDISVHRKPQDGKAQVRYKNKSYDFRVSTLPIFYGEKVTIRILDPDMAKIAPEEIGFSNPDYQTVIEAISKPEGIILVTGPTGSGKSSTLYSYLNKLNTRDVNIVTVEDPVEYEIKGISQVPVNPKGGMTFADSLRSILRQDPDIIMIGEIRDKETAQIAFRAAQTGHLVFSTLHTNDAPSAITRLIDLEVRPYAITSSLIAVIGQRLVRKICPKCKAPDPPNDWAIERISPYIGDARAKMFWKGTGCSFCQKTGYKGRVGIFEILTVTPSVKKVIMQNPSAMSIKNIACEEGFKTMAFDGFSKALDGISSIEEVFRTAPIEKADAVSKYLEKSAIPAKEISPVISPSNEKTTILVVEDNPVTLNMLTNVLEAEHFHVLAANNGKYGINIAVHQKPDIILTDYMMPQMDGLEFIKKLKSHPNTCDIPVIMLTAVKEIDSEEKVFDAGADDYLTKPIKHRRLLIRIRRLLNKKIKQIDNF